ncbi:1,6-dihydroxycyclohexa-2,4-diene-1-carboxylate dehydrogenase [Azospirillum sp. TSH64]|uniref:1,6-dihydroxycyclohexa-2,4-diene-1-carboxylate dehydrogenase n=1 Tax=Azospirillum sp. TSH64 TaxID=652740 RepID=UPI0018EEB549|nr:1,6-dihydroxycyclohexa-2,4-diene-1-carboxylate dehydrogenase [Azospirillum sp. TSH64]
MTMSGRFDNQVMIVTGAAQGIGRAVAARAAGEGARLLLVDRSELVHQVAEELASQGASALALTADLETYAGAQAMVDAAIEAFGRIDISVHNVGGTIWMKPFWEYQEEEMVKEINRSLWPTLWSCRAVIPVMIAQGGGSIVNVGSNATRGIYRVPYSAAKGGVHAMTTCMAMELADKGIRVNAVSPGAVDNGQRAIPRNPKPMSEQETIWQRETYDQVMRDTMMGRMGTQEEIAAAICFYASNDASYITGQTCFVAGGSIG